MTPAELTALAPSHATKAQLRTWLRDPDDADRTADILHARYCADDVATHAVLARTLDLSESTVAKRDEEGLVVLAGIPAKARRETEGYQRGDRLDAAVQDVAQALKAAETPEPVKVKDEPVKVVEVKAPEHRVAERAKE